MSRKNNDQLVDINETEDVNTISSTEKKQRKLIIGAIIFAVVVLLVIIGLIVFTKAPTDTTIFPKNTFVNGVDVSGLSIDDVKSHFGEQLGDVEFVVKNTNQTKTVLGSSFDYQEDFVGDLETLLVERHKNRSSKKSENTVEIVANFNEEKLKNAAYSFSSDFCEIGTPCQNATVEKDGSSYKIVEEIMGNQVDPELLYKELAGAVSRKENVIDLDSVDVYVKPEISKKDLEEQDIVGKLNQTVNLDIGFNYDYTTEKITSEQIGDWVSYDNQTGEISFDRDKVYAYIASLAANYDTFGKPRNFITSNGIEINIGGGIYGWQTNVGQTTDTLIERIKALESGIHEPTYTTSGIWRGEGNNDIGNTYVEVSLTDQNMWFYKNGELVVDTPIVSGLPGTWRETPTGVFSVWSKETKRYISGEDYKLWVDYWIPVNWSGIGLHDAAWQASFGGTRYLTHGSHGCINTPYDQIATIYDSVEVNTPVIIYKTA